MEYLETIVEYALELLGGIDYSEVLSYIVDIVEWLVSLIG